MLLALKFRFSFLNKARIFLPPHPAILPSKHIFVFLILFVQSHLALQTFLSSTFPLLFSFYGHDHFPSCIITQFQTQTIPRLLSTRVSWKMLLPIKSHKNAFYLHYVDPLSSVYLKIRTKLSLFFIFCSITHNVIMLVSLSLQQKSWKHYFSVVFYTFSEHNQSVFIKILPVKGLKCKNLFLIKTEGWYRIPCASVTSIILSDRIKEHIEGIINISMLHRHWIFI